VLLSDTAVLIMKLKQSPKIKVQNTVKLFYSIFSYRICFTVDQSKLLTSNTRNTWYNRNNYSNLRSLRNDLKRAIIYKLPDELECRFRDEGLIVTMYLNDEGVFNDLVSKFGDQITEITAPVNQTHKDILNQNHRIRVRKTLFYDKFRFKVCIKNTWSEKFNDFVTLKEWLENLDDDENTLRWMASLPLRKIFDKIDASGSSKLTIYSWSSYSIFLNDEQDVMMLQLWLNNNYDSVEKVVLLTEV
jgi:hypothetical protein